MATPERIASSIAMLAETYRQKLTRATLEAYHLALEDVSDDDLERACRAALRQCRFMPVPAELLEFVGSAGDTGADRALLAFHAVEDAVVRYGRNKTVDFDDPLVNAAVRLCGGWHRFCDAGLEQFDTWLRKEFLSAYAGLVRRQPSAELCRPLLGAHFRENGFHHDGDQVNGVRTGLEIGVVQRKLIEQRGEPATERTVPMVELKKP